MKITSLLSDLESGEDEEDEAPFKWLSPLLFIVIELGLQIGNVK